MLQKRAVASQAQASSFVYLNTAMVAYVLSLIMTVSIMLFFNAAQPALHASAQSAAIGVTGDQGGMLVKPTLRELFVALGAILDHVLGHRRGKRHHWQGYGVLFLHRFRAPRPSFL